MPNVAGREFPYTPEGLRAAEQYRQALGMRDGGAMGFRPLGYANGGSMKPIEGSLLDQEVADTEARLSWRENLKNRPLGLSGLLDKRGEVDVRSIVPVLHDEAARKDYGKRQVSSGGSTSGWQNPTYDQFTRRRSPEVQTYIQRGIPRERVRGTERPIMLMADRLPTTGGAGEQDTGSTDEMYDAYNRATDLPAHEGFHRLLRNTEGAFSPNVRTEIKFQIPFMRKYAWTDV